MAKVLASLATAIVLLNAGACGSESGGVSATTGGAAETTGGGSGDNVLSGGDPSLGSTGSAGNGVTELCDGIDNDADGVIDNVDVTGDGVCDCIRIATLGVVGKWGGSDIFGAWLNDRSDNAATSLGDKTLTPELLEPFQIVIAQDLSQMREYSTEEVDVLSDWVKSGGGFMTLIGYQQKTETANANTLLSAFGLAYGETLLLSNKGTDSETVPVTEWKPHPLSTGISQVGFDNGYVVEGGSTIASEQGFALMNVQEIGEGHALAWGDEWITYDSEWTEHPEYQLQQLWLNMIKWLTPLNRCQVPLPSVK